jgi:2-methoxy-6-polyprenyl-1,4-benzoquinol methylase
MLDVGKQRLAGRRAGNIQFQQGNAEDLSELIPDNSRDLYTIAFGIRNCTNVDRVLSEAYRVLKPGGRFTCLEFSRVDNAILRMYLSCGDN